MARTRPTTPASERPAGAGAQTLAESKTTVPLPPDPAIDRERLREGLGALLDEGGLLLVVGAAGSGKTTAVAQYARRRSPVAWLTVDHRDLAPTRFIQYLARSLRNAAPHLEALVADHLAGGLSAAHCAEVIGPEVPAGTLVVLDDVHALEQSEESALTLGAFIASRGPGVQVILVARRRPLLVLVRSGTTTPVARIGGGDLAFRRDEVEAALTALGSEADPATVLRLTQGWAAGVAFEVLRGPDPARSAPMRREMLFGYLSQEVLGQLEPRVREAVLASGVLDAVTARRLARLLAVDDASALFTTICRLGLPGQVQDDILRWHPLFREFLQRELEDDPEARRRLLARAGEALVDEGQLEDAADLLFAAGERDAAARAAEVEVPRLLARGDWDKALRWIGRMGEGAPEERPMLRAAQLRALYMGRHQERTTALVEGMIATGELDALARTAPDLAAFAVWGLNAGGRWEELSALLPAPRVSALADAFRFLFAVGTSPVAAEAPPLTEPLEYAVVVPVQMGLLYQGRLDEVEQIGRRVDGRDIVTTVLSRLPRITALTRRGRTAEARRLMESVGEPVRDGMFPEFWLAAEAEIVFDEGDAAGAVARMRDACSRAAALGYRVGEHGVFRSREGRLLVRAGRFEEALEALHACRAWCDDRGLRLVREWADAWIGGALLGLGRAEEARAVLGPVVRDMQAAGRLFELPSAAVLLAEAASICGDRRAHHEATLLAADVAGRMATRHPVEAALRSLTPPAV